MELHPQKKKIVSKRADVLNGLSSLAEQLGWVLRVVML